MSLKEVDNSVFNGAFSCLSSEVDFVTSCCRLFWDPPLIAAESSTLNFSARANTVRIFSIAAEAVESWNNSGSLSVDRSFSCSTVGLMILSRSKSAKLRTHLEEVVKDQLENYMNPRKSNPIYQSCASRFPFVVLSFNDATAFSIVILARRTIPPTPGETSMIPHVQHSIINILLIILVPVGRAIIESPWFDCSMKVFFMSPKWWRSVFIFMKKITVFFIIVVHYALYYLYV